MSRLAQSASTASQLSCLPLGFTPKLHTIHRHEVLLRCHPRSPSPCRRLAPRGAHRRLRGRYFPVLPVQLHQLVQGGLEASADPRPHRAPRCSQRLHWFKLRCRQRRHLRQPGLLLLYGGSCRPRMHFYPCLHPPLDMPLSS